MIRKSFLVFLTLLAMLLVLPAAADEAPIITSECSILTPKGYNKTQNLKDENLFTSYIIGKNGYVSVTSPNQDISGLFLQFGEGSTRTEVLVPGEGDVWQAVWTGEGKHLTEWIPLPEGTRQARVKNIDKTRTYVAELVVYGEGDTPRRAHQWKDPGKADLMLLVAHPDDELLWFGGLLPTYAGERGLNVQVVYLVPTLPQRRLELLDGLWHCGVETYPLFAGLPDKRARGLQGQYQLWNKNRVLEKVVEMIRQVQPEVLVTQDLKGEYGHPAHQVCGDICRLAVKHAADPKSCAKSAKAYGPWQVKKLYIHLFEENQLRLDWHQPLSRFAGQDGLTVANEALQWHHSQVISGWDTVEDGGPYDNARLGLAYSSVGLDVEKNDLMENIPGK